MGTSDDALKLVRAAFAKAQRKSSSPVTTMSLAVLKNRLLDLTDRQFSPKDFGAADMRSFVALLSPDVKIVDPQDSNPKAMLDGKHLRPTGDTARGKVPVQKPAVQTDPIPGRGGRIRDDLWDAVMDYSRGLHYVWDDQAGIARPGMPDEPFAALPTITPVELAEWRQSFLSHHQINLDGADLASVQRWQELGLATAYLPSSLQQPWNREVVLRVRLRIQEFFAKLSSRTATAATHAASPEESREAEESYADLIGAAKNRGDTFTVGELLIRQAIESKNDEFRQKFAQAVSAWGSARGALPELDSLGDLGTRIETYVGTNLATSFINALRRAGVSSGSITEEMRDFAFRIRESISTAFSVDKRSPIETVSAALARLDEISAQGAAAVTRFLRTTPATAKIASVDLLKVVRRLQPLLVPAEREFLGDLDLLLGPSFRKLCEAHERNEDGEVLRRAPEYLETIRSHRPIVGDPRLNSQAWTALVQPVLEHLTTLIEEATSRGEVALAPLLSLRSAGTKADLQSVDTDIFLSFSVRNNGKGHARDVSLRHLGAGDDGVESLAVVEPAGPFDVPPGGEQLVRFRLVLARESEDLSIPIQWTCANSVGKPVSFSEQLHITQQVLEPDWTALLDEPPYTLNPIKREDRLYGRSTTLSKLQLAALAGTSTFVWGQKRIGKTSLLQVLASRLKARNDTACVLLRMGELASLHEGQLAHRIATRLAAQIDQGIPVPHEGEFGAGVSLLVPFIEQVSAQHPNKKLVLIIDEFDDLDPAFYTGERGRQFMKGLRSASEAGLTFFFIGSERMDAIYRRHQADLNKWTNVRLDRIDSRRDCQSLIEAPVDGVIEFDSQAVEFITDYTSGNPFYINNFCYQIFERCLQEHRTFVDTNDTYAVRQQLLRSLGATNFAHLWEDNPVLDPEDKRRESAENCIALACVSALGGRFESVDELMEVQESLTLTAEDRCTSGELRQSCARLLQRGVLDHRKDGEGQVIALQIFREWLGENARAQLLPVWCDYKVSQRSRDASPVTEERMQPIVDSAFPIDEDAMLAVAQRLIFCGKQKDVAEIRSWLRQFDDDSRIEVAFALLQRISDKGFINEGARGLSVHKLEEMINAKRLAVGAGAWTIVKSRRDNLAIGYVDGEHKSGGALARELRASLRPGKCTPAIELDVWMRSHLDSDAMVVLVDDFSGTGSTLVKGLRRFRQKVPDDVWGRFVAERRISLYVLYAFPEALEALRKEFSGVEISAAHTLGDELRACDDEASIFDSVDERNFARQVVQQLGRELTPGAPLGHGNMGALVVFHNATPNNTLPIFWSGGTVGEKPWKPLFPRA